MANDLVRFSVAMPEELLMQFDEFVARRGVMKNRSEVVRDLVRDALVEEACTVPGEEVVGTLTMSYDHHTTGLQDMLNDIQHQYYELIVSTTHVHLDEHRCLEIVLLRGEAHLVRQIADRILGIKGIEHGSLTLTTVHGLFDHHEESEHSND